MITQVEHDGKLIAIIIKNSYAEEGISFFTPDEFSQQLAYMRHSPGKTILPHFHNPVPREVIYTQEILFMKKGSLRVDFYDDEQNYLESRILEAGDVILLASGGHGFEVLEEIEMVEVKQGPYVGASEKTRFSGITEDQVKIKT
ncbi:MAG: hypothetical protein HQM14_03225 [SAR324 cluster bacterium]|nr:hypothetical protein [SAR324 cluster bacterium]